VFYVKKVAYSKSNPELHRSVLDTVRATPRFEVLEDMMQCPTWRVRVLYNSHEGGGQNCRSTAVHCIPANA